MELYNMKNMVERCICGIITIWKAIKEAIV